MNKRTRVVSILTAATLCVTGLGLSSATDTTSITASATDSLEDAYDWDTLDIAGGGYVSAIVTGDEVMYARTDVGGAYRYDYDTEEWVQLLDFITEEDRGYLSVDAMCVDPNDDDTIYLLCGCAYFSDARTAIFRSHDGGETFDIIEVTDLIQVHGNGYGRQCGEAIAVDPDNSDIIYCGGDVADDSSGLIMSTDGGDTWSSVDGYSDLGFFTESILWPTWDDHTVASNTTDEYGSQNGVGSIAISDGKVYVATSYTGSGNVAVADVGSDDFTVLSEDLPTDAYPSRINVDADGNLLITYVGGLAFTSNVATTGEGAYKYDVSTGEATQLFPDYSYSFGAVYSDPDDADRLIACTCAVWYSQLWDEDDWTDDEVAWGDIFFKSEDGGETWTQMSPGCETYWSGPLQADYLQDGGHSWIEGKAIHWCGAIVFDPRDSDSFFVTSGNGIFACHNTWDEIPTISFAADGIEEVVALDFASSTNGNQYSAIGDYDGFIHTEDGDATQYSPTMDTIASSSSTGAIAYCYANPDIMVRCAESESGAFYSLDAGETWTQLVNSVSGATASIAEIDEDTYRIFLSSSGNIYYTDMSADGEFYDADDDGDPNWSTVTINDDSPSSDLWVMQDLENPQYVYAYGYYYNAYYYYSKDSADITDARYLFLVSDDYGETFTAQTICQYDECDSAYRIAYLEEGTVALAAGWYGAYIVSDYGETVTQLDSVYYCKTMGYGAAENEGDPYTLYMYGQPTSSDPEGIYRSTDAGETWVLINENSLYGGTGNGNFLVGDMTEFGTVYMSTVGCGIVVGTVADADAEAEELESTTTEETTTTTTEETTTEAEETTTEAEETEETTTTEAETETEPETDTDILYGDTNVDNEVNLADSVLLLQYLSNVASLEDQGYINADVNADDSVDNEDSSILLQYQVGLVTLPYTQ